jgi:outer membrane protein assembly factor BamD (BamD/ComL family)
MKKEITRLICAAICCTPIIGFAQTGDKFTSTDNLYKEGKELFQERNYAAALPALKAFVKQKPAASLLHAGQFGLRTERQKPHRTPPQISRPLS